MELEEQLILYIRLMLPSVNHLPVTSQDKSRVNGYLNRLSVDELRAVGCLTVGAFV